MSQEPLYVVRDSAGALYGPASAGMLRQWIGEGRVTPEMQVALQGTQNFRLAGVMTELEDAFGPSSELAEDPPSSVQNPSPQAIHSTQQSYQQAPYQQSYSPSYVPPNPYGQAPYPQTYLPQKGAGMAIAALLFGIGSFMCPIFAIVAVILGHMARGQIRREPEHYEGQGMATAGAVLGYVCLGLTVLFVLFMGLMFVVAAASRP